MDPFHHHHHHHRRPDDEEEPPPPPHYPPPATSEFYPPPPPAATGEFYPPPPRQPYYPHEPPPFNQEPNFGPPPPTHVSHVHHSSPYPAAPPPTHVSHVDHSSPYPAPPPPQVTSHHHSFHPHLPSFMHHHENTGLSPNLVELANKPTVKVYCKADPNYNLTIRDGKVVLAPSDPSDLFQHWYKDEKFSTRVKDEEGHPCFALVNKGTGEAMKHSIGATEPVQLIPYDPHKLDESILWAESKDLGDSYRTIRMVNNIKLNVDAFHGDEKSGGIHDGTLIVLWKWNKGDNQRWKIVPFCKFLPEQITKKNSLLSLFPVTFS